MLIISKYPGECLTCHRAILAGDRVSWIRGRRGVEHAACSAEGVALAPKLAASRAVSSDVRVPVPAGLSYLGYQEGGVAYALAAPEGTLIGDEMGLGKTVQGCGIINASPDVRRVLVVCPASLKLNWRNELSKWLVRKALINVWPKQHAIASAGELQIDVINYDILKKLPDTSTWDLLIFDEAHYVKNPKSQRSKLLKALAKRCKRVVSLTGTPIANRPIELWPILQIVAPEAWDPAGLVKGKQVGAGEGAGFFRFAKRYCGAHEVWIGRHKHWDFTGATNLPELQEKLRSTCMVRRLKADVLKELPPKRRQTIELDIGADEELDAERNSWGDDEDFVSVKARQRIQFTEISSARAALAIKKVPAVVEHMIDALESSDKIVLFAHHREVIAALTEGLAAFSPVVITGETPVEERQAAVEAFQRPLQPDMDRVGPDPFTNHRVIIGSIGAMGVGLTLTASSHVVFAELDWTPANVTQAEDRCHRIGQRESVLVQHLVVKGSLDARMIELLIQKQEIADLALDEETLEDVSDRPLVQTVVRSIEDVARELGCAPADVTAKCLEVLAKLRYLATCCDGAQARDGMGFNKFDAPIGRKLARLETLSARQAALGVKMVRKYARQLEGVA